MYDGVNSYLMTSNHFYLDKLQITFHTNLQANLALDRLLEQLDGTFEITIEQGYGVVLSNNLNVGRAVCPYFTRRQTRPFRQRVVARARGAYLI